MQSFITGWYCLWGLIGRREPGYLHGCRVEGQEAVVTWEVVTGMREESSWLPSDSVMAQVGPGARETSSLKMVRAQLVVTWQGWDWGHLAMTFNISGPEIF